MPALCGEDVRFEKLNAFRAMIQSPDYVRPPRGYVELTGNLQTLKPTRLLMAVFWKGKNENYPLYYKIREVGSKRVVADGIADVISLGVVKCPHKVFMRFMRAQHKHGPASGQCHIT